MSAPDPSPVPAPPEPVLVGEAVRVVLMAAVVAGWMAIPSTVIDAIGTLVAAVASVVISVFVRRTVTPSS